MKNRFRIFTTGLLFVFSICILSGQQSPIEVSYTKDKTGIVTVKYRKNKPGTYYLILTFDQLLNAFSAGYHGVLENPFGELLTLKPKDLLKGINFSYSTSVARGIPNPQVDTSIIYVIPFRAGAKVRVTTDEEYSEDMEKGDISPVDWKVFNFQSLEESVVAARKGRVVEVGKISLDTGGPGKKKSKMSNILIEHEDGTFANYAGENWRRILVEPGQEVYPGMPLGRIGGGKENGVNAVSVQFYYLKLDTKGTAADVLDSFKNAEHQYFSPRFQISLGAVKLEDSHEYDYILPEDIIFQEFSKKDVRKWKKMHK